VDVAELEKYEGREGEWFGGRGLEPQTEATEKLLESVLAALDSAEVAAEMDTGRLSSRAWPGRLREGVRPLMLGSSEFGAREAVVGAAEVLGRERRAGNHRLDVPLRESLGLGGPSGNGSADVGGVVSTGGRGERGCGEREVETSPEGGSAGPSKMSRNDGAGEGPLLGGERVPGSRECPPIASSSKDGMLRTSSSSSSPSFPTSTSSGTPTASRTGC
jgi:hypothetical protein